MKWFIFLFIALIFIISPYFKGLYYNSSFYGLTIVISALYIMLIARILMKKEVKKYQFLLPIFLLPSWYLVTAFNAENPKGAWDSVIQWIGYSSFLILVFWSAQFNKIKQLLPVVFQLTGIWLALIPVGMLYGLLDYRSSIVADRFAGVFQYPNTFGMVMATFVLFSLVMITRENVSIPMTILFSSPIILFWVSFIQSYSRSMFLLFPIVWLTGLLLLNSKKQITYILFTMVSAFLSIIVFRFMGTENAFGLLLLIGTSVLFSLFVLYNDRLIVKVYSKFSGQIFKNRFVLPMFIVIVGVLAAMDLLNGGLLFKQLPLPLQERISSVSLSAATAEERMIFFNDAMKISKESPLVGTGGESWAVINKKYQELPYISNKVHNGFLEMLIDTGIIGLILFFIIIGYYYYLVFREYLIKEENTLQIAVLISILSIFLHSFLDFNFSYSTVWLLIFWLFAMGLATFSASANNADNHNFVGKWGTPFLALSVMLILLASVLSYRFIQAEEHYKNYKETRSFAIKEAAIERAIQLDPFNKTYAIRLSGLYAAKMNNAPDGETEQKFSRSITNFVKLEPNNSAVYERAGDLMLKVKKTEDALNYYKLGLKVDHYNKNLYEKALRLEILSAQKMFDEGNDEKARKKVDAAFKMYQKNNYWYDYFVKNSPKERERFNSRDYIVTSSAHYYAAVGHLLIKEHEEAINIADKIDKKAVEKTKANALTVIALEGLGEQSQAQQLIEQYKESDPNIESELTFLRKEYMN